MKSRHLSTEPLGNKALFSPETGAFYGGARLRIHGAKVN
jgi:hypothetical protein